MKVFYNSNGTKEIIFKTKQTKDSVERDVKKVLKERLDNDIESTKEFIEKYNSKVKRTTLGMFIGFVVVTIVKIVPEFDSMLIKFIQFLVLVGALIFSSVSLLSSRYKLSIIKKKNDFFDTCMLDLYDLECMSVRDFLREKEDRFICQEASEMLETFDTFSFLRGEQVVSVEDDRDLEVKYVDKSSLVVRSKKFKQGTYEVVEVAECKPDKLEYNASGKVIYYRYIFSEK